MTASTSASLARAGHPDNPVPDEEVKHLSVGSVYLRQGGMRLDGRYYAEETWLSRLLVQENTYPTAMLGGDQGLAEVWMPGRFKRVETPDPQLGVPFFTPSEIAQARPPRTRYLSRARTNNLESYIVSRGWVLVTRSGTVGRVILTSKALEGMAISEDAIRVIAREDVPFGYLYAYLASSIGNSLVAKDQYGAVIQHIEPMHLAQIPVPILPRIIQQRIHQGIVEAHRLRDEANDLLDEADSLLHQALDLLDITEVAGLYQSHDLKAFTLNSSELDLRLDGSHYDPPGRQVVASLNARDDVHDLRDVTERIFHPFRMNMVLVDRNHGVPFLGGGDIVDYRYFGDKYVSSVTQNYDTYLLKRGWTLLTIGGTIGCVTYVGGQLDGWAASQHVTRIVPNLIKVYPGYLYAFMASDYGRLQVANLTYGAVVDTVRESQLETIRILTPARPVQEPIHQKVEAAYANRTRANELEDKAIHLLESTLVEAYRKRTGQEVALH